MSGKPFFAVTVHSDGRKVLTIDHCSQSGVVDISDRDCRMIYEAACNLLAFLGQEVPGPYREPSEFDCAGGAE